MNASYDNKALAVLLIAAFLIVYALLGALSTREKISGAMEASDQAGQMWPEDEQEEPVFQQDERPSPYSVKEEQYLTEKNQEDLGRNLEGKEVPQTNEAGDAQEVLRRQWPALELELSAWTGLWNEVLGGFDSQDMSVPEFQRRPGKHMWRRRSWDKKRWVTGRYVENFTTAHYSDVFERCIFSPRGRRCVDIFSQRGGPDTEARLIDQDENLDARLYFAGTCCRVQEAAWLDEDTIALVVKHDAFEGDCIHHLLQLHFLDSGLYYYYTTPCVDRGLHEKAWKRYDLYISQKRKRLLKDSPPP